MLFSAPVTAQPIRVLSQSMEVAAQKPDVHTSFSSSVWQLLSDGAPASTLDIIPIMRRNTLFREDTNSCVFPVETHSQRKIDSAKSVVRSHIAFKMNVRVYTKPGLPLIKRIEDIENLRLVHPLRANLLDEVITVPYKSIVVTSFENRVRMLMMGRVDVMVGSSPPSNLILSAAGIDPALMYEPSLILAELPIVLMCHAGDAQEKLVHTFNENLRNAQKDGPLKALFEKHGLVYDEFAVPADHSGHFMNYPPKLPPLP